MYICIYVYIYIYIFIHIKKEINIYDVHECIHSPSLTTNPPRVFIYECGLPNYSLPVTTTYPRRTSTPRL